MSQVALHTKENKMGVLPIPRLLISMSIPMIASMLVQALYNIVDSMFVAKLGESALTAVSLSYPFMTLMIAFGVGSGVGINVLLSRYLGANDLNKVSNVSRIAMIIPFVTSIFFTVLGLTFIPSYFNFQTNDPEIFELGYKYLHIAAIYNIGIMYQTMFEKLLSATGRTALTMITQIIGALINLVLDPILIFGWLGLPSMGVEGAAIATLIGQVVAALVGLLLNIFFNKELNLNNKNQLSTTNRSQKSFKIKISEKLEHLPDNEVDNLTYSVGELPEVSTKDIKDRANNNSKLDFNLLREIYGVAIPAIMLSATGAIMTFLMNKILISYSSTANAIFGIYFNLQSFVFMPIFGLNNGMIPIVSYNFGAKKNTRIYKTMKLAIILAISYMLLGLLIFQFYAQDLLNLFNANEAMLEIGIPALKTISWHFVFAGFSVIIAAFCQALGYSIYSLITSLSRQVVILIPIAFILGKIFGLEAIWYAYLVAEVIAFILSLYFLLKIWRLENLGDANKLRNDSLPY